MLSPPSIKKVPLIVILVPLVKIAEFGETDVIVGQSILDEA